MTESQRQQIKREFASMGGKASWANLTPAERTERARANALKRWAKYYKERADKVTKILLKEAKNLLKTPSEQTKDK